MEESEGYYYTIQQQKVLTFLPILPGTLSLAGSLSVIYVILTDRRKKLKKVFQRLILGMSVMDVIATAGVTIMNGWAIPEETEGFGFWYNSTATPPGTSEFYGARGTVTTCNFSGMFLFLMSTSVGTYSVLLSFYYLLVLRYEKEERWIARYVEPVIHVLALLFPFIFGAILWHHKLFNPITRWHGWCGLELYDCSKYEDDGECGSREHYQRFKEYYNITFTYLFCVVGGWVVIVVDMILIFLKVRATEKRLVRYLIGQSNDTFKQTRQTGIQALLYIASYFITFIFFILWHFPIRITNLFAMACLIKITLPMQGFWNALIYLRPHYQTYCEEKKKRRTQKERQQASADPSAISMPTGNTCPPSSLEISGEATGGEVLPAEVGRNA
jgi:hypothetical protein